MKRFKNILFVVEDKELCQSALERAITLAKNNHAKLKVVDITPHITAGIGIPEGGPISRDIEDAMVKSQQQSITSLVEPYQNQLEIETKVLVGVSFLEIIREVLRDEHDLVIKVPEDPDWIDQLFGSNDMHLLRKCPCPVLLIKPRATASFKNILAAVDVDDSYPEDEIEARKLLNHQILELATSIAISDFSELHIAHAWYAIGEGLMQGAFVHTSQQEVDDYVERVRRQQENNLNMLVQQTAEKLGEDAMQYIKPKKHLLKGWPRKEIPILAKQINADLIVMGTVARTGIPGFIMGNTAESILSQVHCSVLAIKPPGFVSPVTLLE